MSLSFQLKCSARVLVLIQVTRYTSQYLTIGPSPLLQRRHVKTPSAGQDGASHLVDEDVERRLQRGSVPAAHREEAEAHPHVEPLADSAAPEQTRGLGLALRAPACTGDGDEHAEHELSRTCCVK